VFNNAEGYRTFTKPFDCVYKFLLRSAVALLIYASQDSDAVTLTNSFAASGVSASVNVVNGKANPDGSVSFTYSMRPAALPGYGFDPSLGTLNSITITLGSVFNVNDSATYDSVGFSTGVGMYQEIISGAAQIVDYNGTNAGTALVFLALTNGTSSEAFAILTNGSASGFLTISNLQTLTMTDPTILADFVLGPGVQSYNLELIDNLDSQVNTYLAQGSPNSAEAQFSSTIVYEYTPASPLLRIQTTANGVILYWPDSPAAFRLQQIADLTTTNWLFNTNAISLINGTNQVVVSPTSGQLFFRLANP
jgi:hypothetical protein